MTALPPALVLAAGLGTRLRPLTYKRAKPAVPVAGKALIVRILEWLARQEITNVVINLHHAPETITGEVGTGESLGLRVRYSWEPVLLGSAGGPRHALTLLGPRFFIVNGDTLTDLSLRDFLFKHETHNADVSLAVTDHEEPEKYGGVRVNQNSYVTGFSAPGDTSALHFLGVQLTEASVFSGLPDREPASTIGGVYDRLINSKHNSICAHRFKAPFLEMSTPEDYLAASFSVALNEQMPVSHVSDCTKIHSTAILDRTIVWDRVQIGADCRLRKCVVTDDVVLPAGTTSEGCVFVSSCHSPTSPESTRIGNAVSFPINAHYDTGF